MSAKKVKVIKLSNKRIIINKNLIKSFRLKPPYKEDVIFETEKCSFLGEYRKVKIINRLHCASNTSRTIATCKTDSGTVSIKTSDGIVGLIGQLNYDTVLSSLCSVINQELKVRGILSLLTVRENKNNFSQTTDNEPKEISDKETQTEKIFIPEAEDRKVRTHRKRRGPTPYVVKQTPEINETVLKKVVVQPEDFKLFQTELQPRGETLQDLGSCISLNSDEDTSDNVSISALSIDTTPELLNNPTKLLDNVDKHTINEEKYTQNYFKCVPNVSPAVMPPRSAETGYCVPESNMPSQLRINRRNFLVQQIITDWRTCLEMDEDGNLPIHVAVQENNADLLRRQCIILNIKKESVDIQGSGKLTALKLCLYQDNPQLTSILLQFGADPLRCYEEERTPFHIAAEMANENLEMLIAHCSRNARKILEDEDLMTPELESKSDEELIQYLFDYISNLVDNQGYTPLMMASKLGMYENVRKLLEMSQRNVNLQAPTSGNTALFLAVSASCIESSRILNKSKVADKFEKTIKLLLENGADPNIPNLSGVNVNEIVSDFNCAALSMLIANHFMSKNTSVPGTESLIIVKDQFSTMGSEVKNVKTYSPRIAGFKNPGKMKSGEASQVQKGNKPIILRNASGAKKRKGLSVEPETSGAKSSKSDP